MADEILAIGLGQRENEWGCRDGESEAAETEDL